MSYTIMICPNATTSVSQNFGGFTGLDITVLQNDMSECDLNATASILPLWENITLSSNSARGRKEQMYTRITTRAPWVALCQMMTEEEGEGRDSVDHARRDRSNVHVKEMYLQT